MSYPQMWTREALEQAAADLVGKPVTMEYGDGKRPVGVVTAAAVEDDDTLTVGLHFETLLSRTPLDSLRAELPHMRPAAVERDCASRRGGHR
jgi:hypothetical protein